VTALAAVTDHGRVDLLAAYHRHLGTLPLAQVQQGARIRAASRFIAAHGNLDAWMSRPTPQRLADLHRLDAWPFLSWCLIEDHTRADLELLLAKPGGVELPRTWCRYHDQDVTLVADTARGLGWSENWTRQVSTLLLPVVCLATGKPLSAITDTDFDALLAELEELAHVSPSARYHTRTRLYALAQVSYQLRLIDRPRRKQGPVARRPEQLAQDIAQPEMRREIVRYAQTLATTLQPGTVHARVPGCHNGGCRRISGRSLRRRRGP
jgi:hypothetical protein